MFLFHDYGRSLSTKMNDMYWIAIRYSIQLNGMSSCHRNASVTLNKSFYCHHKSQIKASFWILL